jgi:hypothetical protein
VCCCAKTVLGIYKKILKHHYKEGEYDPHKPFPVEDLSDEMLAKFVFSLYEVQKTSASFQKSLSAAISFYCKKTGNRIIKKCIKILLYLTKNGIIIVETILLQLKKRKFLV